MKTSFIIWRFSSAFCFSLPNPTGRINQFMESQQNISRLESLWEQTLSDAAGLVLWIPTVFPYGLDLNSQIHVSFVIVHYA